MRHGISRRVHVWTAESDATLLEAVKTYGGDNWALGMLPLWMLYPFSMHFADPWRLVAVAVSPDATAHQCQKRYNDTVDPTLKRGPWSSEEDARLLRAIAGFWQPPAGPGSSGSYQNSDNVGGMQTQAEEDIGDNVGTSGSTLSMQVLAPTSRNAVVTIPWLDVALFVPGRNNSQCRERYNILVAASSKKQSDSGTGSGKAKGKSKATTQDGDEDGAASLSVNRTRWKAEEDDKLKLAVEELRAESDKDKWGQVAERVGGGRGWVVVSLFRTFSAPASFLALVDEILIITVQETI